MKPFINLFENLRVTAVKFKRNQFEMKEVRKGDGSAEKYFSQESERN